MIQLFTEGDFDSLFYLRVTSENSWKGFMIYHIFINTSLSLGCIKIPLGTLLYNTFVNLYIILL